MATINIPNPAAKAGQAASNVDTFVPFLQLITGDNPTVAAEVEQVAAATTFAAFAVVGRITATGLIVVCDPDAVDGSQNPIGIAAIAKVATSGQVGHEVYVAGVFNPAALVWHAGFTTDEQKRLAFFKTSAPLVFLRKPTVA